MRTSNFQLSLLAFGLLLMISLGCRPRDTKQILNHPAVTLIATDPSTAFVEPTWSPTGRSLALTGHELGGFGSGFAQGIYTLDLQSGSLQPALKIDNQSGPAWTSDPNILSFVKGGFTGSEITTVDLTNGGLQYVTNGGLHSWSPNGEFLATVRAGKYIDSSAGQLSIYVLDMETRQETLVYELSEEEADITGLSWSPDSSWLAFSATWWESDSGYKSGLFLVREDGDDFHQLTAGAASPGWMPDGAWLYFLNSDGRVGFAPLDFRCVVIPLDIADINSPVVSPSGNFMAFEYNADIYLVDLTKVLGANREKLVCSD